jgi:AcrR family transcriptional regulator
LFNFASMNGGNYNEKQLKIISTAETLFSDKGYDGTSVRDIADHAHVNVAMISYYFGSKEKLMQAIFEQRTETLSTQIETLLKDDKITAFEKIEIVIDDYVSRAVKKHKFFKLMICEQMLEKNITINHLLKRLKTKNLELISKLIHDGQQKKVFKKGIDVALLMNTLMGTSMQTFTNADFYRQHYGMEDKSTEDYHGFLQKKLSKHIKELFKAIIMI